MRDSSPIIKSLASQMANKNNSGSQYLAMDKSVTERTKKLRGYKNSVAMRRNRRRYDNRGIGYDYGLYANE